MRKYKLIIKGLLTYIPGLRNRIIGKKEEGTSSARYCYSVWLRHLKMAHRSGLPTHPDAVLELGPGSSLGLGIAALLTGSRTYYALDVALPSVAVENVRIFDEILELLRRREDIPDEREFPMVRPFLDSYDFPSEFLGTDHLRRVLREDRLQRIRDAVLRCGPRASTQGEEITMEYIVPWENTSAIEDESIDMIFSQAVLEHVEDLASTYATLYRWLKPGGYMSHQIDFKCHGTAEAWNGHWGYSETVWRMIKGNRPYLLNRLPISTHLAILQDLGFKIVREVRGKESSGLDRRDLAPRWRDLSDDDLNCSDAFVQAIK